MRHAILLLALVALCHATHAQSGKPDTYSADWKKVERFLTEGLPQSALTRLEDILRRARKDGNEAQQLKALYWIGLASEEQEDATAKRIARLQGELASAKGTRRALLHGMLGKTYWDYLQENRWNVQDRRSTGGKDPDIDTWSADDLHQAISRHFRLSLADARALQAVPTRDWQPIVARGARPALRPTLYDLLAHAALDYFTRADNERQRFAQSFEIVDTMAFAPAGRFGLHRFATPDSLSHKALALSILQSLLRHHLADADPEALIEADLQRLRFLLDNSVLDDREDRYIAALERLEDRYGKHPASAQAAYLRLAALRTRNAGSSSTGLVGRKSLPGIASACRAIMARHPGSQGALNAERMLQDLEKRTLSLMAEKVNIPGQPFRLRTAYRNLKAMQYRIIALPDSLYDTLRTKTGDGFWVAVRQLPALRSVSQPLPDPGDMRSHSAEIRIDPLPVGRYLVLASPETGFPLRGQPMSALILHVSRIAWISRDRDAFVLDRETGRPLHDAEVKAWRATYDYRTGTSHLDNPVALRTDLDGHFRIPEPRDHDYNPRRLEVTWKDDRLLLDENEPVSYSDDRAWTGIREEYETRYRRLYLFTDRKLYRPGQTVQFKGLFVTRDFDTRRPKVITGHHTVVHLLDANGEARDSLPVVTGEYGSFSGSFRLPARGLTGEFVLDEHHGRAEIQVEEYRRPTFDIAWKDPEGPSRLLDTVVLRGEARSFTGAPSNSARVRYRVTRVTRYPYPWYGRYLGWDPPASKIVEVAHGESLTGPDGSFRIPFMALPDRSVDRNRLPVFSFEVSADVTDIGGETRSSTTSIRLGYHTLALSVRTPEVETHPNDRDLPVEISATDLSGSPRPTATTLTLRPLQGPGRFLRERYWPLTDTTVLTEAEYVRSFPYDPYRDEGKRDDWSAGAPVFLRTDTIARGTRQVSVATRGLRHGWYRLELSATEADGRIITSRSDILLRDAATGLSDPFGYFSQQLSTPSAQPGETAILGLATALDDLWVIELLDGYAGAEVPPTHTPKGKRPRHTAAPPNPGHPYRFVGLSKGTLTLELPIAEEDRGGFGIGHVFVRHNRFHSHAGTLAVPWSDKELDIRFTTWRDKTTPGSSEQWSLTVKGNRSEKVAAELLMSMYDASLDAILPFAWEKPELFVSYPFRYDRYMTKEWQFRNSFASRTSSDRSYPDKELTMPDRTPDAFIWEKDGPTVTRKYSFGRRGDMPVRIRGNNTVVMAMEKSENRKSAPPAPAPVLAEKPGALNEVVVTRSGANKTATEKPVPVQFRKDFRETAFFLPELRTDSTGAVSFRFTMPEALTQWKWQVMAHSRDLASALVTRTVITRKELMVQPNAPRFLREGDRLTLPVRITNLSDSERIGRARLELFDPENGQSVDGYFHNVFPEQYFTAPAGQSVAVHFTLTVPADYPRPLGYRILAETALHSDGEEKTLPVLSNRMLVTESMPIRMEGIGTRAFRFEKLLGSGASPTLTQHRLTLEYATNPAWYAVRSLPYLSAYPYECVEQSFNRFYANAVAAQSAAASPRIRTWVERLERNTASARRALASEIGRNPELRDILLEETPWVMDAHNEERQRRSLAILFDTLRIAEEMERAFSKVRSAQHADGGFTWFHGGPSDRYMSQYLLANMGRMQTTGALPRHMTEAFSEVWRRGLPYVSARLQEDMREASRRKDATAAVGPLQVQALYALSCFPGYEPPAEARAAIRHYRRLVATRWQGLPLQVQAMAALLLHRTGDPATAKAIIRSLRERAVQDSVLGMYWKGGKNPWYWHDAPVETQSLLVEAFLEVAGDTASTDRMRLWLLSKKQTERWESTRATADACRALLTGGTDWLQADRSAELSVGSSQPTLFRANPDGPDLLGSIEAVKLRPDMGNIRITVTGTPVKANTGMGWGAAHWQYFEHLDRMSASGGPLSVRKTLYRERMTEKGPALEPIAEESELKVGDKVVVRLLVRADRDMEYVHLKDMRASGTEPADVLSEYRWQGSLGYYGSTRDASTNFFLPVLPKGTHIFEYVLFVSHAGRFPAGIATVECMYAPSFRGHSESPLLRVASRDE
jgi:hypothetical protein